MRRSLILGCLIAITTAAVMLPTASPAAPIIICPVAAAHGAAPVAGARGAAGGPDAVTCCGPPIVQAMRSDFTPPQLCCPGTAMCVQMLTLSSSPNPSDATQKVTVSGTVSGTAASPGTTVTIWQRLPGQSDFSKLSDVTPDGAGNYSLTESPTTNVQWYATANSQRSATIQQQVRAVVTLTGSVNRAGIYALHARVSPAHARQRVMLEMRSGKGWTVIARPRLDRESATAVSMGFSCVRAKRRARLTFRMTFAGDSRNVRSSSAPLTLPQR